ncbi:MAG: rRNA maturation RNase YbeY [Thermodesulfobacteriota bacterium]
MAALALPDAEVSILLVDDAQIRDLNQRYLGRNKPTNVLAFSMREGEFSTLHPNLLGDLVISVEMAKRQSTKSGFSPMEMIFLLMIHGILHLVGYEHEGSKREARKMALKQKELFRFLIQHLGI